LGPRGDRGVWGQSPALIRVQDRCPFKRNPTPSVRVMCDACVP